MGIKYRGRIMRWPIYVMHDVLPAWHWNGIGIWICMDWNPNKRWNHFVVLQTRPMSSSTNITNDRPMPQSTISSQSIPRSPAFANSDKANAWSGFYLTFLFFKNWVFVHGVAPGIHRRDLLSRGPSRRQIGSRDDSSDEYDLDPDPLRIGTVSK